MIESRKRNRKAIKECNKLSKNIKKMKKSYKSYKKCLKGTGLTLEEEEDADEDSEIDTASGFRTTDAQMWH